MVQTKLQVNLKKLFKAKLPQSQLRRRIISKKLDFEIKKRKEILEKEFKTKYGYKRTIPLYSASDYVAEQLRRERYKNG